MIIYKATNLINGKIYIGYTYSFEKRKSDHLKGSKKPKRCFHYAIKKHGPENFKWEIIDSSPKNKKEAIELEKRYILQYNSFGSNGYNLTLGGDGIRGYKHSIETKIKISKSNSLSMKGIKYPNRNKPKSFSDEHRRKLSITSKNRPRSLETRMKNSIANKGRKLPPWTEERRIRLSKVHKERWEKAKIQYSIV